MSGGILLLVAIQVPWLQGPLDAIHLSDSEGIRTTMLLFVLTAMAGQITDIGRRLDGSEFGRTVYRDNVELYAALEAHVDASIDEQHRTVDVLGAHLGGILPFLQVWALRAETKHWTVRVAAMTALHPGAGYLVADEWLEEAHKNVALLRSLIDVPDLIERGVAIEIHEYDFPPMIYGARFGTGDLLVCFLRWASDGRLSKSGRGYELIPHTERTASADSMRQLFDSWFRRARES